MAAADAFRVTLEVVAVLDRLGIDYLLGGSLASSVHGIPRSTLDVDLVVALDRRSVSELVSVLAGEFYVDAERAFAAVDRRRSFNAIHLETMFKVDLFVLGDDSLSRQEMERRQEVRLPGASAEARVWVASPEDTVLQKLLWFRLGREVSDRQWRDAVGVLKVQGGRLDMEYLRESAREAALDDLLERALDDAGLG